MKYTTSVVKCPSTDGIHTLYGKIYIPIGTPKAVVQIIHGMSEHTSSYTEFADRLAKNGFVVYVYDQLGHGRTARTPDELGFFAKHGGSDILINDAVHTANVILKDYTGIKRILYGHSMGSFTARLCAAKYPQMVDMLILEGTSGIQHGAALGLALTNAAKRVKGAEYRSEITQKIFLNVYNRDFKEKRNDYEWTSSDCKVTEEHSKDPYYNFTFSISAMQDVVDLCTRCNCDKWYKSINKKMPVLILSGEKDPVGSYGKGVSEVYNKLKENGVKDVTLKLYKACRHELLHDVCKEQVIADVIQFGRRAPVRINALIHNKTNNS